MSETTYTEVMLGVAHGFEIVATLVISIGLIWSTYFSVRTYIRTKKGDVAYKAMRQTFGGALLLGLEILVAGDLIRTVAVEPNLDNVLVLGIIVLIRTLLSFSIEIEIDGVLPWRKALVSGATVMKRAAQQADSVEKSN
ncbi:MAG: DUF1622 domain-containing protein [Candidatus Nanopelagicales bacterium]|jgi:uncharacterized membrane protein